MVLRSCQTLNVSPLLPGLKSMEQSTRLECLSVQVLKMKCLLLIRLSISLSKMMKCFFWQLKLLPCISMIT